MQNYIVSKREWEEYKKPYPNDTIHWEMPSSFPCIVFSFTSEKMTNHGKQVEVHHEFVYVDDAMALLNIDRAVDKRKIRIDKFIVSNT